MVSNFDLALQEKIEISSERDSLKSQLDLSLKENDFLKSKNDCDDVLKKNEILSSKLDIVFKREQFFEKQNCFNFKRIGFDF